MGFLRAYPLIHLSPVWVGLLDSVTETYCHGRSCSMPAVCPTKICKILLYKADLRLLLVLIIMSSITVSLGL